MAVRTSTASSQTATPKAQHIGVTVARSTFTLDGAASTTASDVVLLVKIPNGAVIVDGYIQGSSAGAGDVWKVGTAADDNCCSSTITLSATGQLVRFGGATTLPFKVSLSDDAEPKWTWLKAENISVGSSSTTLSMACVVYYSMDLNI